MKLRNFGYTFIELIIVISIIVTITSLTVPAILNYQKSQAENEEVKNFISTMRTYQNLALTNDIFYCFNFSNATIQDPAALKIWSGTTSSCNILNCDLNTNCKGFSYKYISPISVLNFTMNRYGNLVDSIGQIIGNEEITFSSPTYKININKFGRIYETK